MLIGYARTVSAEDTAELDAQMRELTEVGCEEFFCDQASVLQKERPELDHALRFVRKGDVLVATRLDRIATTVSRLIEVQHALEAKGADLRILSMHLDTSTPNGQLMLQVLAAVAELEQSVAAEAERLAGQAPAEPAPVRAVPRAARPADAAFVDAVSAAVSEPAPENGRGRSPETARLSVAGETRQNVARALGVA